MKELVALIFLLIASALVVLVIHAYILSKAASHPTFIYFEDEPTVTATVDESSNSSSIPGNSNWWGYYPMSSSLNYTGAPLPTPTPTIAGGGSRSVKN